MSSRSIEPTLNNLLPTLNDNLPSELVDLAVSLLAQSRTRVSSLKAEEEIARPYICADIACKRLKARLGLPATQPRPPCPPRVYKKLYAFLDPILQVKTKRARDDTSIAPASTQSSSRKPKSGSAASTPFTTPQKSELSRWKSGNTPKKLEEHNQDIPWLMPLIRRLCNSFSTPQLPPHVFAGTSTVLRLVSLDGSVETRRDEISTLVIAIYFMALTKMRLGEMRPDVYTVQAERALQIAGLEVGSQKQQVDDWIKRVSEEGWAKGQAWWENVPEDVLDEEIVDIEEHDEDPLVPAKNRTMIGIEEDHSLLPGLGTMMQDKVDWLSEARMLEFQLWKRDVLAKAKLMEKKQTKTQMVL